MAPSSLTLNYDSQLTATLFNYKKTLEDAISTSNAFFYALKKSPQGYKKVTDIGDRMAMPLMYELGNADSYSGYDTLDTTPSDGLTTAFFNWSQAAVPISLSGLEKKQNRGDAKIIDLLEAKMMQAELGLQDFFNRRLLQGAGGSTITTAYSSPMNGSTFVDPLPKIVMYDPTTAVTVGNIAQGTYTWWRNQTTNMNATTYKGYLKQLRTLRNNCAKGPGGGPDIILGTQGAQELYVAALADMSRNTSYTKADIPFDNVEFFGGAFVWDEFVPDAFSGTVTQTKDTVYMLNTKYWGLRVDSETDFSTTPFITPENQDASTAHILWLGGVGCSNRRKQGVGGGIDRTIAT